MGKKINPFSYQKIFYLYPVLRLQIFSSDFQFHGLFVLRESLI